jgi:hypothetical protein
MIETVEQQHATLALRLLLDQGGSPPPDMTVDWPLLLGLAQQNSVLVRLGERLEGGGLQPPPYFAAAAARARQRAHTTCSVMRHIAERCARHGIHFLFPTAWQHFPDAGGDLDLLVLSRARRVDALILEGIAASLRAPDLRDRLAGTSLYWLRESGLALDVHHGRLGVVGEHAAYPADLIRRRQRRGLAQDDWFVPAPEDQLILQGMSRVAGRRSFSLGDATATIRVIRGQPLDWGFLVRVAHHMGVLPGLCCYLSYVDAIYGALYGHHLLPPEARQALTIDGWGSVAFREGRYRFPSLRVRNRLYWRQLAAVASAGEWRVASRLCLVPAMVVACSLGLVGRDAVEATESITALAMAAL